MRRMLVVAGVVLAAVVGQAIPAEAGNADVSSYDDPRMPPSGLFYNYEYNVVLSTLRFLTPQREDVVFTSSVDSRTITLQSSAAKIVARAGCTLVTDYHATCSVNEGHKPFGEVRAQGTSLDDHYDLSGVGNAWITAYGGAGNDHLVGGSKLNHLHGDDGDDVLESTAYPDRSDILNCGAGNDTVFANPLDQVNADCENVTIV